MRIRPIYFVTQVTVEFNKYCVNVAEIYWYFSKAQKRFTISKYNSPRSKISLILTVAQHMFIDMERTIQIEFPIMQ